jgi:hypothetical protein
MSEAIAVEKMDRFLEAARDIFNLTEEGRGGKNAQYIDADNVRVGEGHLPDSGLDSVARRNYEYANPVVFVTGLRTTRIPGRADQPIAPSPSISLIVGQYGLGKTELIFQICHQMADSVETALPINLALSRDRAALLERDDLLPEEMADLLFGRILGRAGLDSSFAMDELLPAIRNGNILLLLDGLDELISTPTHHHTFFAGLIALLNRRTPSSRESFYKVVITMRFEYLAGVADDARDLVGRLRVPVYYLVLDYLEDTAVWSYLKTRLPQQGEALFEEIQSHRLLIGMFRRPLILRIFCDLAARPDFRLGELMSTLRNENSPAALLEAFIDAASKDTRLRAEQEHLSPVVWDATRLSTKSLDLYRNSRNELTIADLREVIVPIDGRISPEEQKNLSSTEVLDGLHKCPFIRRHLIGVDVETAGVATFAHKIFYEYFTSRGIAAEILDPRPGPQDKERAFDELVLNVDMRKFLRGLLDSDHKWRDETKRAYGLVDAEDLAAWNDHGTADFDELEERRWLLLQYTTDPEENVSARTLETVDWFLERQEGWLHPRYRLYNYEAVAVLLWYERRNPAIAHVRTRFGEILDHRLDTVLDEFGAGKEISGGSRANKLLLERLLDIGRRLGYPWVTDYGDPAKEEKLMRVIGPSDADVANRVKQIIRDIRVTVFG